MGRFDIRLKQGETFRLRSYYRQPLKNLVTGEPILDASGNPVAGVPVDLFGWTGRMQIRRTPASPTSLLTLSTTLGGLAIPAPDVRMLDYVTVATTGEVARAGFLLVDGVQLTDGDRILVKDQLTPTQNGIYLADNGSWPRINSASELTDGATVWVYGVRDSNGVRLAGGRINADTVWRQTQPLVTLSDEQAWEREFALGRFDLHATAAQTSTVIESGVYDVELESPSGDVARPLEGKVRLSREVTKVDTP